MKVAIYARYWSENHRDASIADQFRVCREFARRQGWQVGAEYSDHAISGATIMRPGFQAMMREALQKKFDAGYGVPALFMATRSDGTASSTTSCKSGAWSGIGSGS
jgi:hypothetical protein